MLHGGRHLELKVRGRLEDQRAGTQGGAGTQPRDVVAVQKLLLRKRLAQQYGAGRAQGEDRAL